VVIGVFIVINLFIAVVLNNLETVRAEQEHPSRLHDDLLQRIEELKGQLEAFESALRALPADRIDPSRTGEGPTSTG
jgi:hypothetical protein